MDRRSGRSEQRVTSPSPLERLAGPRNVVAKEPPDAKEFEGLVRAGLARLKDAENETVFKTPHELTVDLRLVGLQGNQNSRAGQERGSLFGPAKSGRGVRTISATGSSARHEDAVGPSGAANVEAEGSGCGAERRVVGGHLRQ